MIFLLLNILITTILFGVFKLFPRFGVRSKEAIVVNYMVAAVFAWLMAGPTEAVAKIGSQYTYCAALLGLGFLYVFNKMSQCTVDHGVGVASIAAKLSLVVPVLIFMLADASDSPTAFKVGAVLLAFPAVILASAPPKNNKFSLRDLRLPAIVFFGSGLIDTGFGWFSGPEHMVDDSDRFLFTAIPFTVALIIGLIQVTVQKRWDVLLHTRTLIGGSVLGVVNVGTLYFLLRAFQSVPLDRSAVIPLNNLGIVLASAAMGVLFFGERTTGKNAIGFTLAVVCISMLLYPML